MSRIAFLTRVFAFSHVVPPSLSTGGFERARVLLDQVQPLHWHEQLVVAVVAEFHELLLRLSGAERDLLEPDKRADAVVDVHDVVADLQIAQVGEERLAGRPSSLFGRAPVLVEDVGLRVNRQRRGRQAESARQPARPRQ